MSNNNDDLDKYKDQWEKALKDGFLDSSPHLPPPNPPSDFGQSDFFGQWDAVDQDAPLNECDAKYWNKVYRLSNNQGDAPCPIKEEAEATKDQIKKTTSKIANAANPVYPTSVGKDQESKVTANWSDGKELQELAQMKMRLEKLESQMNAKEGMGKKGNISKIESLRKQIDELSDSLAPNRSCGD